MDYFQLTPPELIEIVIAHLNYDDVKSFLDMYTYTKLLNWSTIWSYHFDNSIQIDKGVYDKGKYLKYLSAQSLKTKFPGTSLSKTSIEEILNTTEFHLSNQIKEVPSELFNLTNLTRLYLGNNQLHELPAEIFKLTNLRILDLNNNRLQKLPAEIFNLTNL